MLVPMVIFRLFLTTLTTNAAGGSQVTTTCHSCATNRDRLRGRVGESVTVQFNISNPDSKLLRFTIWYNGSHEIILSMEPYKPPKVTSNNLDPRIPEPPILLGLNFISVFVTIHNLTMADNELKFQYRIKLKSVLAQELTNGFKSLSVEQSLVGQGIKMKSTVLAIAVVVSVSIVLTILIVVLTKRRRGDSIFKCSTSDDVEKNPGPPREEPPLDPPPRAPLNHRTSAAALLAASTDETDGYHNLNQIDRASYAEVNDVTAPAATDKYLPASVFKMGMDSGAADELLSTCGTPGVYVVRKGRDGKDVLSAYLLNETKHYKIFVDGEEMYLRTDQPKFVQLVNLLQYYHQNNLPTCHARLERPYQDTCGVDAPDGWYQNVRDLTR